MVRQAVLFVSSTDNLHGGVAGPLDLSKLAMSTRRRLSTLRRPVAIRANSKYMPDGGNMIQHRSGGWLKFI